jgi:hypothetical protein
MKNRILLALAALLLCAGLTFTTTGCNKGTLAPGSLYTATNVQPSTLDYAFFQVDSAFALAYATCDTAFTFEANNAAFCWKISPDIKHTLDKIRPEALNLAQQYSKYRKMFIANPTLANLSPLQTALNNLQPLTAQAQAAITVKAP